MVLFGNQAEGIPFKKPTQIVIFCTVVNILNKTMSQRRVKVLKVKNKLVALGFLHVFIQNCSYINLVETKCRHNEINIRKFIFIIRLFTLLKKTKHLFLQESLECSLLPASMTPTWFYRRLHRGRTSGDMLKRYILFSE